MSNFDEGFGVVRQLPWSVHLVSYNDSEMVEACLLLTTVTHVTWISMLADCQGDIEVDTTRWVMKFCEVLEHWTWQLPVESNCCFGGTHQRRMFLTL